MLKQGSEEILKKIYSLPDLLTMAKAESGSQDCYKSQDSLREKYVRLNLPYKWSMPLRHLVTCSSKEHTFTEVLYKLGNPTSRATESGSYEIEIRESEIHEVREHGAMLNDKHTEFLSGI